MWPQVKHSDLLGKKRGRNSHYKGRDALNTAQNSGVQIELRALEFIIKLLCFEWKHKLESTL